MGGKQLYPASTGLGYLCYFVKIRKHTPDHSLKKAIEFCHDKLQKIKKTDREYWKTTSSNSNLIARNKHTTLTLMGGYTPSLTGGDLTALLTY
jgi:hypothetical protein